MPKASLRKSHWGLLLILVIFSTPSLSSGALPFYVPDEIGPFMADARFHIPLDGSSPTIELINGQLNNGKRLRPLLCYLGAGILNVGPGEVESLACAAEWAHNASLFHDDVLDNSETRRGSPTLWKLVGVDGAVLLGDKLLTALTRKVLRDGGTMAADSILQVIEAMTEGEWLQRKIKEDGTFQIGDWNKVAIFKTGLLFSWSLSAPAMATNASEDVIASLRSIGADLGRMFQLRDDIDDSNDPEELGQINLVFLKASEISGQSPLRPDLDSPALASARGWAKNHLRVEITSLQKRIQDLSRGLSGGKEQSDTYRARCARSLVEIFDAIAGR